MKKTGVIKNKVKTTYKIAIGLNIFTVLVSIINLFYDVYWESRDVFFGSIYLLLVPHFKFLKSQNYFEIIPAVILLAITILLLYKSTKNYCNANNCKPIFVFIFPFWIILSTLFTPVFFIDSNPYGYDNPTSNIVFYIIYAIYQAIISIMVVCDYDKDKPTTYNFSFVNTEDIYKSRYLITMIASLLVVSAVTIKYVCNSKLKLMLLPTWFLIFFVLFVVLIIGFIFDYKKIVRKFPEQKWNKKTSFKFVMIQFLSISLYVISYIALRLF